MSLFFEADALIWKYSLTLKIDLSDFKFNTRWRGKSKEDLSLDSFFKIVPKAKFGEFPSWVQSMPML